MFYPAPPTINSVVDKLCRHLGYQIIVGENGRADVGVYWDIQTWRRPDPELIRLSAKIPILNLECLDFSKHRVERVFHSVSGQSLRVDPRVHVGRFLVKSDVNAAHDGTIVDGPIEQGFDGRICQRVVNNQCDAETVVETPINLTGKQKELLRQFEASMQSGGERHNPQADSWLDGVKKFFEGVKF